MNVRSYYQQIVWGPLILVAITVDQLFTRKFH